MYVYLQFTIYVKNFKKCTALLTLIRFQPQFWHRSGVKVCGRGLLFFLQRHTLKTTRIAIEFNKWNLYVKEIYI